MEGILPVYKPVGITSYDVIRRIKKLGVTKKIGHGGTLDPFAEGVLLILIGRAGTKQFDSLRTLPKTYVATATLGASSDTMDRTGTIVPSPSSFKLQVRQANKVIPRFVGEIEQDVPEYSAAKVAGRARYSYARAGVTVPSTSKKVTIYSLHIIEVAPSQVTFEATVSSGTYIRQLSYDLFHTLGIESYLNKLVRTRIGEIEVEQCMDVNELSSAASLQNKLLPTVPVKEVAK